MIYQVVRARSRKRHFVFWVITLAEGLNVDVCFN
jgi:hypothetical protein